MVLTTSDPSSRLNLPCPFALVDIHTLLCIKNGPGDGRIPKCDWWQSAKITKLKWLSKPRSWPSSHNHGQTQMSSFPMSSFIALKYIILVSDRANYNVMLVLCYKTNKYNVTDVKDWLEFANSYKKSISLADGKHGKWQFHFPKFNFGHQNATYIHTHTHT